MCNVHHAFEGGVLLTPAAPALTCVFAVFTRMSSPCSVHGMTTPTFDIYTFQVDFDALDEEVRKTYPRFTRRHGRWLVAVEKSYNMRTGEHVQVLRTDGSVRVVELQDQVLYEPYNMKRGTKDVFLYKDITAMVERSMPVLGCHLVLLDGTGRCDECTGVPMNY